MRAPAAAIRGADGGRKERCAVSGEQPKGGISGRPAVLVVDDEEMVRVALTRNLSRLGCDVVVARDGEEALRIAPELKPAVVFLDLRMPGLDGHALMRRLPERGVAASIVVMSGDANLDDVIDALRKGAVDFLKKPWSTSELASALERGIEVFRTLPQIAAGARRGAGRVDRAHRTARSRTPRPDSAREKLLQRLQSPEPPAPGGGRPTVSHLHRSARDLDAANHARAPTADEIVHLLEGDPGLATAVHAPGEQPPLPRPGRDAVPEHRGGARRRAHGARGRRDAGAARRLPDPRARAAHAARTHLALLGRARPGDAGHRRGHRPRGRARARPLLPGRAAARRRRGVPAVDAG